MNLLFNRNKKEPRYWGCNPDGTKYQVGITVADLKSLLEKYPNDSEVCMVVCPKKYWNGGGWSGKLKTIEDGSAGQIWLKGLVLDESLEI